MEDKSFGTRFTELMESRKISNKQLTELAEVSKNNVGNYQKGQIPNATILYRLSQIFGVSMEFLLTGKDARDLTPEEQLLVDHYRHADDRAQESILQYAESESARHPKSDNSEQLLREQQSSTSKIG